ncbi:NAD-dependent epimerase/dehydratase family protein [Streptomyces lydicus]|uniref:NAD-dependent epimerase/dehydratase family protein n=1 Tax=Streptomyces lydicus TaxID=47763 RepID=UPI0036F7897D
MTGRAQREAPGTDRRVLVLGGSGFLGRHLTAAFHHTGWQVTVVSRSGDAGQPAGRPEPAAPRRLALDVAGADPGTLTDVLTRTAPHVVVNAAGAVWAASEEEMARGNVLLVDRLLTVLPRLPRPPRLLQLGTAHEYGPPLGDAPVTEAAALRPVSGYGRTKARASEAVLGAARDGALEATVLRVSNAVGAGLPPASLLGGVAAALAAAPGDGAPAVLRLGPLTARRDFVDATDVAEAVVAAAAAPAAVPVVNIGRGTSVAAGDLVRRLLAVSGRPAELVERQQPAAVPVAPGGAAYAQRLDITLARRALGWRPGRELDDSLRGLWLAAGDPPYASGPGREEMRKRR